MEVLEQTRAKIGRGRKHIEELQIAITNYLHENPVITVGFERIGGGRYQFEMRSLTVQGVPDELVMIFGDAVHNTRAALDWSINELMAQRGTPTRDLSFPFSARSEGLGKAIRDKMKDTSKAERDIVRELKPYRGGNDLLWSLHDLDLRDKHRAPLEVSIMVTSSAMMVQGLPEAPRLIQNKNLSPVPEEHATQFIPKTGFNCLGVLEDARCEVVIAKERPKGGQEPVALLTQLADAVETVVGRFEALS